MRQLSQAADDGYRSELVTGVKATADAERLAAELAFATARLAELAADPPALYADIASLDDPEEALWLAFLVAYIGPLQNDEDPFAEIRAAHVPWASGEMPNLDVTRGPRSAADPAAAERTILAYRAWANRAGSQAAAFAGEPSWTPERRFDRVFERLALPGLGRGPRYELLVSLGRLGHRRRAPVVAAVQRRRHDDRRQARVRDRRQDPARAPGARSRRRRRRADRGAGPRAVQLGRARRGAGDVRLDGGGGGGERAAIAGVLGV